MPGRPRIAGSLIGYVTCTTQGCAGRRRFDFVAAGPIRLTNCAVAGRLLGLSMLMRTTSGRNEVKAVAAV